MNLDLLPTRFRSKFTINHDTNCWDWHGTILKPSGYGQYYVGGGQKHRVQVMAHRFAFECLIGPIPAGLEPDHLCRNRRCVNPTHMEPVTPGVNVLRGIGLSADNARKTECVHGHPFDDQNTYRPPGNPRQRMCRTCMRERAEGGYERRQDYHHAYRRSARGRQVQREYRARKKAKAQGQFS